MGMLMNTFQRSRTRWGKVAVAAMLCLRLAGCSGGDDVSAPPLPPSPPIGVISGRVTAAVSGSPVVAGATVRTAAGATTSAADGSFTVPTPVGDRSVVHIGADGFAETFRVTRVRGGETTSMEVRLLRIGVSTVVNVANGGTVTVPNSTAQVRIPANGLMPEGGGSVAGTVTVAVTPVNPAADISLMPGDFTAVPSGGGASAILQSWGAMQVQARDNDGIRYSPVPGMTATLRIPLGTRSSAPYPDTIPLWYFNENTGVWQEDGTATLRETEGNWYYEGSVARFGYWNADMVMETIVVSGCVRDTADQPVDNAVVQADGIDYSGYTSTRTAADGSFRVAMRRASRATLIALEGTRLTPTTGIGPFSADSRLPACLSLSPVANGLSVKLSWGQAPLDLDSHLYAPNGTLVYFGNRGALVSLPFANLDVDDTTSFGPEVITITRLMQGTYQYVVHNFSGTFVPGMTDSPSRVELTRNGVPTLFVPPAGEEGNRYWHVFDIVIDAQCQATIVPVNNWLASPAPPASVGVTLCPVS